MTYAGAAPIADPRWPRLWRVVLVGFCTLILCSCQGPAPQRYDTSVLQGRMPAALPSQAYAGAPPEQAVFDPPMGPPGMEQGVPMPYSPRGPWAPPGISQPWPEDEYLRDGGDRGLPAGVGDQWEVHGLELEDTIAHFETLDGQIVVEPSNRVHIYSPRFGAVRRVASVVLNEQSYLAGRIHQPQKLVGPTSTDLVATRKQNVQPDRQIGARPAVALLSRQGDGVLSTASKARAFQDTFLPYENVRLIRQGIVDSAEMPFIARGAAAAIAWSGDQAVQVILDHRGAMARTSSQTAQSVFTFKEPPPNPRLRVVKVASTPFAEPGDEVAFTIRFDNVGNQAIGNVTIIDNLSSRLEYVADSGQCSVDAQFFTQPNAGDSLVVRCEVTDPLEPGEGGILRFRCRVR